MAASKSCRASESQPTAPLSRLEAEALIVASGVRSSCDTEDSSADLSRSLSSRTLARVSDAARFALSRANAPPLAQNPPHRPRRRRVRPFQGRRPLAGESPQQPLLGRGEGRRAAPDSDGAPRAAGGPQVADRLRRTVRRAPSRRLPFPHPLAIVQSLDADLDAIGEEFLEGQPSYDQIGRA